MQTKTFNYLWSLILMVIKFKYFEEILFYVKIMLLLSDLKRYKLYSTSTLSNAYILRMTSYLVIEVIERQKVKVCMLVLTKTKSIYILV